MILDTVAVVRLLRETLEADVLADLEAAETLSLSAVSLFEINQKVRIGKLDMPAFDAARIAILRARGLGILPIDAEIMASAATMAWTHAGRDHRDPFDRMIAATALVLAVPVVTSDAAFRDLAQTGLNVRWI